MLHLGAGTVRKRIREGTVRLRNTGNIDWSTAVRIARIEQTGVRRNLVDAKTGRVDCHSFLRIKDRSSRGNEIRAYEKMPELPGSVFPN